MSFLNSGQALLQRPQQQKQQQHLQGNPVPIFWWPQYIVPHYGSAIPGCTVELKPPASSTVLGDNPEIGEDCPPSGSVTKTAASTSVRRIDDNQKETNTKCKPLTLSDRFGQYHKIGGRHEENRR